MTKEEWADKWQEVMAGARPVKSCEQLASRRKEYLELHGTGQALAAGDVWRSEEGQPIDFGLE